MFQSRAKPCLVIGIEERGHQQSVASIIVESSSHSPGVSLLELERCVNGYIADISGEPFGFNTLSSIQHKQFRPNASTQDWHNTKSIRYCTPRLSVGCPL